MTASMTEDGRGRAAARARDRKASRRIGESRRLAELCGSGCANDSGGSASSAGCASLKVPLHAAGGVACALYDGGGMAGAGDGARAGKGAGRG